VIFIIPYFISALVEVPVLSIAVPKLWLFLVGNVLTQYPLLFCLPSCYCGIILFTMNLTNSSKGGDL